MAKKKKRENKPLPEVKVLANAVVVPSQEERARRMRASELDDRGCEELVRIAQHEAASWATAHDHVYRT